MRERVVDLARELAPSGRAVVFLNTRDNHEARELYLTVTGSSIESGDEGVVGRGNRHNGVISFVRPMSMEGVCGKNPVYHAGKLYNVLAQHVAEHLFAESGCPVTVWLVSQSGRDLVRPAFVGVQQVGGVAPADGHVAEVVDVIMDRLPGLQESLIAGGIPLC